MKNHRALIFVPTYNERENVEKLCSDILRLGLNVDILFLDDNSPDGTGEVLDELAETYPNVMVIHRPRKLGIGSAHLDGINWAYDNDYELLVTMDCDFTHRPGYLPHFIDGSIDCDVVVGSRYLVAESLKEWSLPRKALTLLGHTLTRVLLRMRHDATGAFRVYRLSGIPQQVFDLVRSTGYSFFFESLYILQVNRFKIKEIPIELPARTYGHSKMRVKDALDSLSRLMEISTTAWFNVSRYRLHEPPPPGDDGSRANELEAWDEYWQMPKTPVARVYGLMAGFYRKNFVKRNLNRLVGEHFPLASHVLHAGCGRGEVDTDIPGDLSVTALDISAPALMAYKRIHNNSCNLVRGSVFYIPLENESVDGVYNLGLMEHFTEEQIHQILKEFSRVLKWDGKMIVFWPPKFGLSVYALKTAHFVLNKVLRRDVKLHPDEITLLKSKKHAMAMFEKADFTVDEYYFGARDLFTQSMVVVTKAPRAASDRLGQSESGLTEAEVTVE